MPNFSDKRQQIIMSGNTGTQEVISGERLSMTLGELSEQTLLKLVARNGGRQIMEVAKSFGWNRDSEPILTTCLVMHPSEPRIEGSYFTLLGKVWSASYPARKIWRVAKRSLSLTTNIDGICVKFPSSGSLRGFSQWFDLSDEPCVLTDGGEQVAQEEWENLEGVKEGASFR